MTKMTNTCFLFYFDLKFDLVKCDVEVIVPLSNISAVDADLFCLQVVGSRMEGPVLQKQVSTF